MNSSKKYNLIELLSQYTVQIPILQRDFAQGRNKQAHIRENFLTSIFNFLNSTSACEKSLDFIYGYKDGECFIPIDGQQRITTLWLLYIYLTSKLEDRSRYAILKNFTYATRDTSKRFCKELTKVNFTDTPSKLLRNDLKIKGWVTDGDPTVSSMLTMLDAIDSKFNSENPESFLERLSQIKFNVIDLEDFNLGEDLYVKMNSRGKQLSSFENFKSWIQKDSQVETDYNLLASIDNNWVNFFWKRSPKTWESDLINMISYFSVFFVLLDGRYIIDKRTDTFESFLERNTSGRIAVFNEEQFNFNREKVFTHKRLKEVDKAILFFITMQKNEFALPKESTNSTLIPKLFSIFFYALTRDSIDSYSDWNEVTNHIIYNYRSRHEGRHIVSMFNLLKELSRGCSDIFGFLSKNPVIENSYAKDRIEEEKLKAHLIITEGRHQSWEQIINQAQNHSYFNGWIDFLFEYAKEKDGSYSISQFETYSSILCPLFEQKFLENNLILVQRTLLSFVNYSIYYTNWYLGTYKKDLQHGKEQWDKILKNIPILFKLLALTLRKKLSDKEEWNNENLKQSLQDIINENIEKDWGIDDWWRWLLVYYPDCLRYCESNRFVLNDDVGVFPVVYLIPKTKFYTNGRNLLCFGLWKYLQGDSNLKDIISIYNDDADEPLCFSLDTIKVYNERWTNSIVIKKYGHGSELFQLTQENKGDYNNINEFYRKIYKYIIKVL